jgi:8-oxo-dGTP pyrophosphatase MutT (NUDIX family)
VNGTIHAVGGIAVRKGARPRVAVVQRSKDKLWVLPRGKLRRDERPIVGARREVVEETGFRVEVREFLGVLTYEVRGRAKVVQFWLMQAEAEPSFELMKDIVAVKWLSLGAAVKRLSYPVEKLFLTGVGRHALRQRIRPQRRRGKPSLAKAPGVKAASVKTGHAKTANAKKTVSAKKTPLRRKNPTRRTRA